MYSGQFKCSRCGKCCTSFLSPSELKDESGLMLYPDEIHLFKPEYISPSWGNGKNPNHKRFKIITYQMNQKVCPFYNDKCTIYEKRPLVCRLYPIDNFPSYIVVHKDCTWAQQIQKVYPKGLLGSVFPTYSDEHRAWIELRSRFQNLLKQKYDINNHWDYNCITKKWSRSKKPSEEQFRTAIGLGNKTE